MNCPPLKKSLSSAVKGPVVLVIMDGVGIGQGDETDAVAQAHTPNLDALKKSAMFWPLQAHGTAVGMPSDDDMGNSEVGHNTMGAGRIIDQGAKLVNQAFTNGSLFSGEVWKNAIHNCLQHQSTLHFIGLLSDGNVHSHIDHLCALIQKADEQNIQSVCCHILLDGRDVAKTSALLYVEKLETLLKTINTHAEKRHYCIASGGGRMQITMDRYEADWPMVERGWQTHVLAQGRKFSSASEAIQTLRQEFPNIVDQDLPPFIVEKHPIETNDSVIAFNFRGDRMLELVQAFEEENFTQFNRGKKPDVYFAGMTLYDGDTQRPKNYLVPPPKIECTLSELLSAQNISQLACSETQKFGHVTYFWNGNKSGMFNSALENYVEIPSYAQPFENNPHMRAPEITRTIVENLSKYQFLRLNFANGDMIGHTGDFTATVKSIEAVDACLGQLIQTVLQHNGALLITADHGNADDMFERDKKTNAILKDTNGQKISKTSHSLNAVPCYLVLSENDQKRFTYNPSLTSQGLANIAATIAILLGFEPPALFLPPLLTANVDA